MRGAVQNGRTDRRYKEAGKFQKRKLCIQDSQSQWGENRQEKGWRRMKEHEEQNLKACNKKIIVFLSCHHINTLKEEKRKHY